jgi:GMP synthase-like glutamine amidotransferase
VKGEIYVVKHVEDEGPGLLEEYFRALDWEIRTIGAYRGDTLPENLESVAALVILGGPMNVYEEEAYPFLRFEDRLIRQVLREKVPFLGICLGAQLLAKACGAAVTKSPHKEIGWFEVKLTETGGRDSLFHGLPEAFSVFQWHEDTFAMPEGASLLATSELCRNQAFRMGDSAYGLQFHVEVTPEMIEAWKESLGPIEDGSINGEAAGPPAGFEARATRVFENFRRLMESAARARGN